MKRRIPNILLSLLLLLTLTACGRADEAPGPAASVYVPQTVSFSSPLTREQFCVMLKRYHDHFIT